MLVPSSSKNAPIRVFGYALVPPHSAFNIFVKASRKDIQVVEHEPCSKSDAVQPVRGVLYALTHACEKPVIGCHCFRVIALMARIDVMRR